MPAESSVLEQVKSCGSVSCLINMEPSELLRLQPSEPIASESVLFNECFDFRFQSAMMVLISVRHLSCLPYLTLGVMHAMTQDLASGM